MRLKRLLLMSVLMTVMPFTGLAQQQILNTQYVFNRLLINPAYAGIGGGLQASFLYRKQWSGIDGAPNTQVLSMHSPINREKTASLGGMVIRDEIGVTTQTGVYITGAYALKMSDKTFLSFGLQGGFLNDQSNFGELEGFADDPLFVADNRSVFRPNFGAGVYLYDDRYHIGISVPNLFEQNFQQIAFQEGADIYPFVYLDAGYLFYLKTGWTLDVNTLIRSEPELPLQFDINGIIGIRNLVWLGLSYRSFESVDALFRLKLSENYYFAYSYDISTGPATLSRVNAGSHELMIQFGLNRLTRPRGMKRFKGW
ncbi:MAG: type IX secretion system membrane protein PorP/SprF [Roseivirga sp.]|nr:type IX secretion system membrane protein PorP/SprF [Roseivirga sp.]